MILKTTRSSGSLENDLCSLDGKPASTVNSFNFFEQISHYSVSFSSSKSSVMHARQILIMPLMKPINV